MILEVALPININKNFSYNSDCDVEIGCRVVVPFGIGKKKLVGFVVGTEKEPGQLHNLPLKKIIKIVDDTPLINDELLKLATFLSERYLCSLGCSLNLILPSTNKVLVKKIEKNNICQVAEPPIIYTAEQENAISKICDAINNSEQKTFLLFGPNDSGKTEIYTHAIALCLKNNCSTIYLVPDISLISQFEKLLRNKFGETVGVWHSGLSQKEKDKLLSGLLSDKIRIILGTRSSAFLPIKNPKLFIVDEEDDDFYKNTHSPKYHAKDVILERAKITNSVVVLGSATPSIDTYYKTKNGDIELLKLTERVSERPLPKISVINLKFSSAAFWRTITKPLKYAITNALLQKKQVFLLVNRRGWATTVKCSSCQNIVRCPKCSVPLVAHKNPTTLLCHYCGYQQQYVKQCNICFGNMIYAGYGTERVEEIIKRIFPSTEVIRMDSDSEISYSKMFEIMKSGRCCILVGTQIVAKGFDFPNLTVVGIINAYAGLYSSDFRSAEKTFSLITHSIGRCGRGTSHGEAIIQTDNPEHYAIKYASSFNYEAFYNDEIKFRKDFSWPPFVKLISVAISGKNEKVVISDSEKLADDFSKTTGLTILGPVEKVVPYLAYKHRWQILLKLKETDFPIISGELLKIANSHKKKGVNVVFDVDPVETS